MDILHFGNPSLIAKWKKMFMEFNAGLKIVRMVPTKIPGDLGYVLRALSAASATWGRPRHHPL